MRLCLVRQLLVEHTTLHLLCEYEAAFTTWGTLFFQSGSLFPNPEPSICEQLGIIRFRDSFVSLLFWTRA
jgi:hypothetical protein